MNAKKILLLILCVVLGIALLAGCVLILISRLRAAKFRSDELMSCRVDTSGGMLGGVRNVTLTTDEDGGAVLRVSEKETHADRLITTQYRVSAEAFGRVRDMVSQYNLYGASKRPRSRIRVLDAATTSISFSFSKGDFRVSEDQVLSGKMRQGFREVIDYLTSLAVGEGTVSKEPQRAVLYLRSGYTLQFVVEDVMDGRLDDILSEERETSAFGDFGIVLASDVQPDVSGALSTSDAEAGTIVYDPETEQILILYADHTFDQPVFRLAVLDGYVDSACPLIAEMEGAYRLILN